MIQGSAPSRGVGGASVHELRTELPPELGGAAVGTPGHVSQGRALHPSLPLTRLLAPACGPEEQAWQPLASWWPWADLEGTVLPRAHWEFGPCLPRAEPAATSKPTALEEGASLTAARTLAQGPLPAAPGPAEPQPAGAVRAAAARCV